MAGPDESQRVQETPVLILQRIAVIRTDPLRCPGMNAVHYSPSLAVAVALCIKTCFRSEPEGEHVVEPQAPHT